MSNFEKNGFYFDDLKKLRVLEEEVSDTTSQVREQCQEYFQMITEFQQIADGFIKGINILSNEVEEEKMKVIGSRNLLLSVAKQRDAEKQQLQAMVIEKTIELERLGAQLQSLMKTEAEQKEIIEQLVLHH